MTRARDLFVLSFSFLDEWVDLVMLSFLSRPS
jgi:hypothetical protein